MGKKLQLSH